MGRKARKPHLDGQATSIEDDTFANPCYSFNGPIRLVAENSQGRWVQGTLAYSVYSSKPLLSQGLALDDQWLDVQLSPDDTNDLSVSSVEVMPSLSRSLSSVMTLTSRKASVCISLHGVSTISAARRIPKAESSNT